MRSTKEARGRFYILHIVYIVRCWAAAESAEPNVVDHSITRLYLCLPEGIKHSLNLGHPHHLSLNLASLFMLSSNAGTLYFPWSLCLSSLLHPFVSAAWLLSCFHPTLPVWTQAAGVLRLGDQRASERQSPSKLGCLCRRRRENLRLHLQSRSFLSNRRERLSHPRMTRALVQIWGMLQHSRLSPAGWAKSCCFVYLFSFFYERTCELLAQVEVSPGKKAVWVHARMK